MSEHKKNKSAEDYANGALDVLHAHGMWVRTNYLCMQMQVPNTSRDTFGKAMQRLVDNDVVRRSGTGKYTWKINVQTWDRSNPFKRQTEEGGDYNPYAKSAPEATEGYVEDTNTAEVVSGATNTQVSDLRDRVKQLESKEQAHTERLNAQQTTIAELTKKIEDGQRFHKTVEFKKFDGTSVKMKDVLLPKVFKDVYDLVRCRRPVMLVGPAGCGKTHLAKLVSDSFGFDNFGTLSCTEGATESHLFGRGVPNLSKGVNNFEGTDFLTCFEEGGLFLLDEIDAANANFLLSLNTALANGYATIMSRTKKRRAEKHPDFVCMGAANTFGKGANRQYVGRNQLDEATLDRFRIGIVECDYDDAIEQHLCPKDELRNAILAIREKVRGTGLLRIVSTRFMMDAHVMHTQADWPIPKILDVLVRGWTKEEKIKVGLAA